eukprot:UN14634
MPTPTKFSLLFLMKFFETVDTFLKEYRYFLNFVHKKKLPVLFQKHWFVLQTHIFAGKTNCEKVPILKGSRTPTKHF